MRTFHKTNSIDSSNKDYNDHIDNNYERIEQELLTWKAFEFWQTFEPISTMTEVSAIDINQHVHYD